MSIFRALLNRRDARRSHLFIVLAISLVIVVSSLPLSNQKNGLQAQASTPTGIRFAVIGDYGSDTQDEAAVAYMINGWNPDLIITVGDNRYLDNSYDDTVGQYYCDYLKDVQSGPKCAGGDAATSRFFPTLGNHDYSDGGGLDEYLNYFSLPGVASTSSSDTERYYDFVMGPVHFFALDSHGALASRSDLLAQQDWLRAALAGSTSAWNVVFFHHSAYSSASHHGSSQFMQWPFEAWGADVVFGGHTHSYERLQIGGIPFFVSGTGGKSLYDISSPLPQSVAHHSDDFGAMLVTVRDGGILYEYYAVGGILIDSVVVGDPLPTPTPSPAPTVHVKGALERAISQPGDDVEELSGIGAMSMNSNNLELVENVAHPGGTQIVGLRFTEVAVPRNATIQNAHIEFVVNKTSNAPTSLLIAGERGGDARPFSPSNYNVSARPLTSSVTWDDVSAWEKVGHVHKTPDLGAIVRQIVSLPTWMDGNAMVFVFAGSGLRTAAAHDISAGVAPQLHIEYVVGQPPYPEDEDVHMQFFPSVTR